MSRPLRIEFPGAIYHVMNRGLERRVIFPLESDHRAMFKGVLADTVLKWKIVIHAYALMSNHYHLLIETPLGNISRAMRHIDGIYTQRFNRAVSRDGPLFRGRFKSLLVQVDAYFLELVRYIHLNGVRANLVPNARVDKNGSHWDYLHPHEAPLWLEQSRVLSFFQDSPSPLKALDDFVHQEIPNDVEEILSRKRWPAILGTKEFVNSIKEKYLPQKNQPHPEMPQKRPIALNSLLRPDDVQQIVFGAAPPNDNLSPQERIENRWLLMWAYREFSQLTFREIGHRLGGKSGRAIQKFLARYDFQDGEKGRHIREKGQCHM